MMHLDLIRCTKRNRTLSDREDELKKEGCSQQTIDMYRKLSEKIDPAVKGCDRVVSVPRNIMAAFKEAA